MKSVLHGTWTIPANGSQDRSFFVWAERAAHLPTSSSRSASIQRHPYAATAIEIADLLDEYVAETDWRRYRRMTRVLLLPSVEYTPIVPLWLVEEEEEEVAPTEAEVLKAWRVEGIGIPLETMLDVLVALPLENHQVSTTRRLGNDLRYWGLVAKFGLELLARERFLPGMRSNDGSLRAMWVPVLDEESDQARFLALAKGMPAACRALFRERAVNAEEAPRAQALLASFLHELVDGAVREWGLRPAPMGRGGKASAPSLDGQQMTRNWWRALWSPSGEIKAASSQQSELTRFYQGWQSWTYKARSEDSASFRICFRLEPPEFDQEDNKPVSRWTLRYFLQATDDPSLLVPAREVWRERGDVLSYLNRRFDHPQEQLLEGLGMASRLCPPIRRSLGRESPEATVLTDREAYTFLRETARLLEGAGFGVLVPPWWNKPDTRLRVRARLRAQTQTEGTATGMLGMESLIAYDWELALGDETLTREEFERLAALKTPLVQVRGRWVLLQPDQVEAAIAFWEKHGLTGQLPLTDALGLALGVQEDLDGLAVADVELDDQLTNMIGALTQKDAFELLDPPEGFVGTLRPYQVRGYSWLVFLRRWGFGACLADDMGLGKTIQAIALLLHERERSNGQAQPALVICPTSLVGNWHREVSRFAPSLRVLVHHGSDRAEGEAFVEQAHESDLIISTYGLMRRDIEDLQRILWSDVILDEAQNIKNPTTKQARAARRLRGLNRVALTGTPVENRLTELWSIMTFLNPGYLGSLESFRRSFAIPVERYQDQEAAEQLRRLVRPFILRRLKTDPLVIQDLPEKFEYKVYCNLTREQATLYEAVVRDAMEQLDGDGESQGIRRRGLVLAMLTRLKQVCNHPALYLGDGSTAGHRSGKLNRLVEMLEEVLSVGDRALVFTQFAQMGHLLQRHLQDTFGEEVLFLHGGTPQRQRDRMLRRFQEEEDAPSVFVLSLKAGGTGLNLMRANHVFHFDRWWNPAVENQATDRAYRIGQTRDVQVHKFICGGTLEERIDALIESKRALADNVVGQGEAWLTELSTEELREMITLRAEAVETE